MSHDTLGLILVIVWWAIGWLGAVAFQKPENAADGAFVLVTCLFVWPLLLLGWIVSRPWADD
jgi:hypothetical protein